MKKYEIHLGDWQRILFGQAPPVFLLEVFIRTLIIYIFLLFVLRLLGKRMSGQLTILEMAVMLTLGAIVSVAMQTPDRGIALSMIVLICTLIFQRGLSRWGLKNARVEEVTQGTISTLLQDGVMDLKEMGRCGISRQQLFAELRSKGVYNLGQVRRVYLEACGLFTTIRMLQQAPGLPTLPPGDQQVLSILHDTRDMVCRNCGNISPEGASIEPCSRCKANDWTPAVTTS
ncbi:MAG TPA: YetF domain-containing protein [Chitinophaga sp.]|uniref:DUF421 domain-containing protein n=1 Tax=Chitinophaga sp. TaxID=1869181 RepID=UPI002F91D1D2